MPLNQIRFLRFLKTDMLSYIFKRLLLFIPSIILIGAFTFFLFHASPADPIDSLLRIEGYESDIMSDKQYRSQYERVASELELDLPKFYFGLVPSYYPDTLYKIINKQERKRIERLLLHHNDWGVVSSFLDKGKNILTETDDKDLERLVSDLINITNPSDFSASLSSIDQAKPSFETSEFFEQAQLLAQEKKSAFTFPKFLWFGFDNQFHSWMSKFFSGTLGRSVQDGRPVWNKISKALGWTIFLVLIGMALAVLISIPLGVWSATDISSRWGRVFNNFFYFIYAMPLFWFATLMVVFFTTSQYGSWTNIFPGVGISPYSGDLSTFDRISANSKQLILPIFCIVLNSIAYVSNIVRNSIIVESNQAYKTTALLKGLTKKSTFWKHLFPNSILPLVTIIVGAIPASLAGSLIIEVIFNIPGIGRLMFDSIFGNDWYVIFSIVMLVGMVTIISYLIGDILYSYLNPKIRFGRSKSI